MEPIEANKQNTVNFKDDIEYLLFTLINCEVVMSSHKEDLTYAAQIWSTNDGFALTFQAFNKETMKPAGKNDTKDQRI